MATKIRARSFQKTRSEVALPKAVAATNRGGGVWYLKLPGGQSDRVVLADNAGNRPTGDQWMYARFAALPPAGDYVFLGSRWDNLGDNISQSFSMGTDGWLQFDWSETGPFNPGLSYFSSVTLFDAGLVAGEPVEVACTIDVDNGAGAFEIKFWWRRPGDASWTQLGATEVGPSTTSIFAGTADFEVGSGSDGTNGPSASMALRRVAMGPGLSILSGSTLDIDFSANTLEDVVSGLTATLVGNAFVSDVLPLVLLRRTSSGRIRHHTTDSATQFITTEWTLVGSGAVSKLAGGELQVQQSGGGTGVRGAIHTAIAARAKRMIQARITRQTEAGEAFVAAGFIDATNYSGAVKEFSTSGVATDREVKTRELDAGSQVAGAAANGSVEIAPGSYARLSIYRDGTTLLEGYSHEDDIRQTLSTGLVETAGQGGLAMPGGAAGSQVRMSHYYDSIDKIVACSGLADGEWVQVRASDEAVLAEDQESGGSVSIDCFDAWLPDAQFIVVLDATKTTELDRFHVLNTLTPPQLVFGGDVYAASRLSS